MWRCIVSGNGRSRFFWESLQCIFLDEHWWGTSIQVISLFFLASLLANQWTPFPSEVKIIHFQDDNKHEWKKSLIRTARENRILAGLWYGNAKPDMSVFLKPMASSLKKLYHDGLITRILCCKCYHFNFHGIGVLVQLPGKGPVKCCSMLLCSTCDMPARALVMNMVQYNGFHGCSHCLQRGKYYYLLLWHSSWLYKLLCRLHL